MAYIPYIPSATLPSPNWRWTGGIMPRRVVGPVIRQQRLPSTSASFAKALSQGLLNALSENQTEQFKKNLLQQEWEARQRLMGPYYQALSRHWGNIDELKGKEIARENAAQILDQLGNVAAISPKKAKEVWTKLPPQTKAQVATYYPEAVNPKGDLFVGMVKKYPTPEAIEKITAKEKADKEKQRAQAEKKREKVLDRVRKTTDSLVKQSFAGRKSVIGPKETVAMPALIPSRAKYALKQMKAYMKKYPKLRDELESKIQYLENALQGETKPKNSTRKIEPGLEILRRGLM